MARKNNTEELIHCNVCGEDYSPTYRRCPFCGERADARTSEEDDFDDGYVFDGQALFDDAPNADQAAPNKGGKRLAAGNNPPPKSGGSRAGAPAPKSAHYDQPGAVNWVRVITFGISLVIIIAALIIVFTVIYPMIHTPDVPEEPTTPGTSTVEPNVPDEPATTPPVTEEPTPPASEPPAADPGVAANITNAAGGLNVRSGPGTTYDVQDSLKNGDSVTIMEVTDNGWYMITYIGKDGKESTGYVKSDYVTAKEGDTPAVEPSEDPSPSPSPDSGSLKPGSKGKIVGAASGLNVRSGPGTTYSILASLFNGNEVTILEDAGNGWYKIAYSGANGKETVGYIMGTYVSSK